MPASTVTSKGQITVPSEVRRALGLRSGSRVNFVRTEAGSYELVPETQSVRSLRGSIAGPVVPVTLEEMDGAIHRAAEESGGR